MLPGRLIQRLLLSPSASRSSSRSGLAVARASRASSSSISSYGNTKQQNPVAASATILKTQTQSLHNQRQEEAQQQQPSDAQISTTPKEDAVSLVKNDLKSMFQEVHEVLDDHVAKCGNAENARELCEMSKYYFDGQGKAIRPVIALTLSHAMNTHVGCKNTQVVRDVLYRQRRVAIISEMIHTSSLVHDDVLDHAEMRRGKLSVNRRWDACKSAMAGDYILAVAAKVLAQLHHEEILVCLSQVLSDLVTGEFQQLQSKTDEAERFRLYLQKTFNKTASLIAYSCKANAILAADTLPEDLPDRENVYKNMIDSGYEFGSNIGLAFQLIDDLLDFESSAELLGKPAAADLKLGLATAPVLFALKEHPELESMIQRRFSKTGDVDAAFAAVKSSSGLEKTRELAREYCDKAIENLAYLEESPYKKALVNLADQVITRQK